MLLPGMLSILCHFNIVREKKCKFYNLKAISVPGRKLIFGKTAYLSLGLFFSNLLIFAGTFFGGSILGTTIPVSAGMMGAILLSISYLWEIPLYLFLSARFGMFTSIFTSMLLSAVGVATLADRKLWWICPSCIPVRLMCPVLGLLPNGLPVPTGSEL